MEGIEFYCMVYYYCLRFIELRAWAVALIYYLSIDWVFCCKNSTDPYLDGCFCFPKKGIDKTDLICVVVKGKNIQRPSSMVLVKYLKSSAFTLKNSNPNLGNAPFFIPHWCLSFLSCLHVNIWWSSRHIETNLHHIMLQLVPISHCPEEYCVIGKQWKSTASTVIQCQCIHVIHSIQEVPWPFLLQQTTLVKIPPLSLTATHSTAHPHRKHTESSSASLLHNMSRGEINTWLTVFSSAKKDAWLLFLENGHFLKT